LKQVYYIGVKIGSMSSLELRKIEEIFANVRKAHSFSFETTLSGRFYSRHIPEWRSSGYKVKLFYLRLATPELAFARVRKRVLLGGHDVPEHIIRRRFVRVKSSSRFYGLEPSQYAD
jgi:predicted ABC-type ATPase